MLHHRLFYSLDWHSSHFVIVIRRVTQLSILALILQHLSLINAWERNGLSEQYIGVYTQEEYTVRIRNSLSVASASVRRKCPNPVVKRKENRKTWGHEMMEKNYCYEILKYWVVRRGLRGWMMAVSRMYECMQEGRQHSRNRESRCGDKMGGNGRGARRMKAVGH